MALLEQFISDQYIRAIITALVSFAFLALVVFIGEKILLRFTTKTKTNIDDKIFSRTAKPLVFLLALISIRLSLNELVLSAFALDFSIKLIYSGLVIGLALIIYAVLDVLIMYVWNRFSTKSNSAVYSSLTSLIHGILSITLIVLSILYILDLWGLEIGPLLAGLGIAGLAVALALQPTLSNIFSGASMVLDKSVRVGDWIILENGTWGVIDKISLRSTKVKSFDNELLVVPNSKLADSTIHNVALPEPKSRVVIPFSVAYGSNIERVKKIVLREIAKVENITEDEPIVRFLEMANSSLNFKAFFYVKSFEDRYAAIDEANTKIYNALNKAGISIPFPQMDVHLKKDE